MSKITHVQQAKTSSFLPRVQGMLQHKCTCGNHTIAGGECVECAKNKRGLQRKLPIGSSNDPLEQEADRVAEQVMAAPAHPVVSGGRLHIQRFTRQSAHTSDFAPASVSRVLASSGRPLESDLRQDMERRFSHDFSRVRIHSGAAAEQSARDVSANAYTVGHQIVFGAGRPNPKSTEGRRLLAHELGHVVQQDGGAPVVQRWAECFEPNLSGKDCPEREAGEAQRARAEMVFFSEMKDPESGHTGALIANFDIDKSTIKSNLLQMVYWQQFLKMMAKEHTRWKLLGFTDCHENEGGNTSLGKDRAAAVLQALPEAFRSQIVSYDGAPDGACMRGNVSGADRAMNRSVALILDFSIADFSDDEEQDVIVGKTPQDRLRECQAGARIKTFPFRTTRFGGAPIMARQEGDEIVVELPMHVRSNKDFRKEVNTLPIDTFLRGTRLQKGEIVRVRHYEVPHWYSLNITGDASSDNKTDYCVPAEKMLDWASAANKAFLLNVAVTGVDALTLGTPVGKLIGTGVSKIAAPAINAAKTVAQKVAIGGMLGLADVAPTAFAGVASRTGFTLAEGQVGKQVAGQAIKSQVAETAVTSIGDAVSRVAPAAAQEVTHRAPGVVTRIAETTALEAVIQSGGNLIGSTLSPASPSVATPVTPPSAAAALSTVTRVGAGRAARGLDEAAAKEDLTFVEIGAGDLQASIELIKKGGVKVIAVDPQVPAAAAVKELESLGGQFVKGVAANVAPGTADHVFQYFPWKITGTGSFIQGGTWRLTEDTVRLLKPGGAAHFVTEELATAEFLAGEASKRGLKAVITETAAGAAAPGASGAGVPAFSKVLKVWMVNIYK